MSSMLRRFVPMALVPVVFIACAAGKKYEANQEKDFIEPGTPNDLAIGFNGPPDNLPYLARFETAANNAAPAKKLCHTYVDWTVGEEYLSMTNPDPSQASDKDGTAQYLMHYLWTANGSGGKSAPLCDEVLLSFKSAKMNKFIPPTVDGDHSYKSAMTAFFKANFKQYFPGDMVLSPWNEPNNPEQPGNGIGKRIPAETAARYYLQLASMCQQNGQCKVVAGDFASNTTSIGKLWNDFESNCFDDNVDTGKLVKKSGHCVEASVINAGYNKGNPHKASYLDIYKHTIANEADQFPPLEAGHLPMAFAYHGWVDINKFVYYDQKDCNDYTNCLAHRVVLAFSSNGDPEAAQKYLKKKPDWTKEVFWDTETGIGQSKALSNEKQACGAAFLIRNHALDKRIQRMYVTRLFAGGGHDQLFTGNSCSKDSDCTGTNETCNEGSCARPAAGVLARRQADAPDACSAKDNSNVTPDVATGGGSSGDCSDKPDGYWCINAGGVPYMAQCVNHDIAFGTPCDTCTTPGTKATCAPPGGDAGALSGDDDGTNQ